MATLYYTLDFGMPYDCSNTKHYLNFCCAYKSIFSRCKIVVYNAIQPEILFYHNITFLWFNDDWRWSADD